MESARVGIVGAGRMGAFHAAHVPSAEGIELVAVIDTRADVAASVAAAADATPFTSIETARDAGLDGVIVATPTHTHHAIVRSAIDLGLGVLCEKPLTLDVATSADLIDAASRAGVHLQLGFWRRFSAPWARAKAVVDSGAIGEIVMLRLSQWDADAPPPEFCNPASSGGLAIDCGVHEYDLAEWFTGGQVTSVDTRNLRVVDAGVASVGDVDNLVSVLDLDDGVSAVVDLSRNARYDDDVRTEILGSEGAIFVDLLPSGRTRIADRDGTRLVEGSETDDAMASGVIGQAHAFGRLLRGVTIDVPDGASSIRALRIGQAVAASGLSGERIDLQP